MNKNVKRIVAMAVAIGAVSAVAPATNVNLLTTKAYASNSDAEDLESVDLQDDDGDNIDLYTDDGYDSDDELDEDLDEGDTYYAESKTDQISVEDIKGPDEDKVRIFEGSTEYEVGDSIDLDDGVTTLKIRVYEDDYDEDEDYSSSDYNQYTIKVEYKEDEDDNDDDENDEDKLDKLELLDSSDQTIKLYSDDDYEDKVSSSDVDDDETYYAKTSSKEVSIKTDGPDDDYVKIFKTTSDSAKGVDPGDSISVSGDKTLTVRVYDSEPDSDITYEEDDDVASEYTIELEYTAAGTGTSTPTTPSTGTNVIKNKWVQVNGKWQYKDGLGNSAKNTWMGNYFLQADGNMATSWLSINGSWYYFGTDGAKKMGWQSVGGTWYYLDTQGKMLTGWIKDMDGKYYYLNSNGSMAYNTIISGYKLGPSGAWVK